MINEYAQLWLEAIAMAADNALIQATHNICGRLRQQRIFYNRGPQIISVMCCNLRYFTY